MKKWIILLIITLAIVNLIFLLQYMISETDRCNVSCTNKGYESGECISTQVSQKPCENNGLITDSSYNLYCEEKSNVCCCK